jgi:hypothetical protein
MHIQIGGIHENALQVGDLLQVLAGKGPSERARVGSLRRKVLCDICMHFIRRSPKAQILPGGGNLMCCIYLIS